MFIVIAFVLIFSYWFVFVFYPKFRKWNYMRIQINKFPGRQRYPIIGNLDVLFGNRRQVYLNTRQLAVDFKNERYGQGWVFNLPFIFILKPEEAEALLSSTVNIRKSMLYDMIIPWLGTGLLTSTGNKWHSRRKMLTPAFHFTILKKYLSVFNKESKRLAETLKQHVNEDLDVVPVIMKFTLDTICESAMGTPLESIAGTKYYQSIHDFGEICVERVSKPWLLIQAVYYFSSTYWRQCKIIKYLHEFSMNVINSRKKTFFNNLPNDQISNESYSERKKGAMLDILLSVQKENGSIDDEGIREEVDTFMFEGHDTTALALVHILMLLANNKIHQDKIYNEIISVFDNDEEVPTYSKLNELKYMEMSIKECLRLRPSVPLIARELDAEVETLSGLKIPANCTCFISILDLHKISEIWPNPEVFDPNRFLPEAIAKRHPFAYIPFSAGPRNCIGQKFVMMELKCALTEVLRNFILEPIDSLETIEYNLDLLLRPADPVRVKFIPRVK